MLFMSFNKTSNISPQGKNLNIITINSAIFSRTYQEEISKIIHQLISIKFYFSFKLICQRNLFFFAYKLLLVTVTFVAMKSKFNYNYSYVYHIRKIRIKIIELMGNLRSLEHLYVFKSVYCQLLLNKPTRCY